MDSLYPEVRKGKVCSREARAGQKRTFWSTREHHPSRQPFRYSQWLSRPSLLADVPSSFNHSSLTGISRCSISLATLLETLSKLSSPPFTLWPGPGHVEMG